MTFFYVPQFCFEDRKLHLIYPVVTLDFFVLIRLDYLFNTEVGFHLKNTRINLDLRLFLLD